MNRFRLFLILITFILFYINQFSLAQSGSSYTVSGVVVSEEDGETLPGVAISVGETSQRAVTNIDGKFSLILNTSPVVLHFSYVGMNKQSVTVTSQTKDITVKLQSSTLLSEVVIEAGYGLAQKRSDMVGSAFQVQSKDLQHLPPARIDKMLDGLVPGLTVEPNSDSPGSPRTRYNIRVRGEASLAASNEPLWIIDGVPVYQGTSTNMMPGASYSISPLSYLNPNDIESVTVLKDASSTSIYGANGANGVIIVKTKSGMKLNNLTVNTNIRYGISNIDQSTRYKVMNASQYLSYAKEAWVNGGQDINSFPFQNNDLNNYTGTDVDWGNLYFGQGQNYEVGVSLSSSSEKNTNRLSLSYYNEQGTIQSNKQQRFSARYNTDYKFGSRLTFGTILSASYNHNNLFAVSNEYYEVLPIFTPYMPDGYTNRLYNRIVESVTYDSDGNPVLSWKDQKFFSNSIPEREDNKNVQRTSRIDATTIFKFNIMPGLDLTEQFGVSLMTTNEEMYSARTTLDGLINNEPKGYSRRGSATYLNWNNILRLNYQMKFGDFNVGALAGIEFQHNQYSSLYATGSGFLNDHIQEIGYSESSSRNGSSSFDQKRSLSYLGQAHVSYKNKYYLTANARADGNSSFGKYSRWAKFGSVGLSWNIHNEDFFTSDIIELLKFKTSLGTNGNSRIDSSINSGTYTYSDTYSYNGYLGAVSASIANPGLSWESTTMFNAGMRTTLFGDRLDIEVEYYNNYTKDLLTKIYTSRTISDDRLYANVGEMRNQGLEVTFNSKNIKKKDFSWNTDLIFSHNRNKITKLYNGMMTSYGTTVWSENYPRGAFYLVRWAGVDPSTGAPMWYDKDGNLTFNYSADDRVILEDKLPEPWGAGSLTNTLGYKNFSFRFMFIYSLGGNTLSALEGRGLRDGYSATDSNSGIEAIPHWTEPGQLAINPRISTVTSRSGMSSTRFLHDRTNVRLHNMVLSYFVPKQFLRKMQFNTCTISLIGDNLFLWTPDQKKDTNSYKTLMNAYPVERSFSLSLNLSF